MKLRNPGHRWHSNALHQVIIIGIVISSSKSTREGDYIHTEVAEYFWDLHCKFELEAN